MHVTVEIKAPIASVLGFTDDVCGHAHLEWLLEEDATIGAVASRLVELSIQAGRGDCLYVEHLRGDLSDVAIAVDGYLIAGDERRSRPIEDGAAIVFLPRYVGG